MALRANLDAQLFFSRAGGPRFAAGAVRLNLLIFRVNLWFHWLYLDQDSFRVALETGSIRKILPPTERRAPVILSRRSCIGEADAA